MIGNQRPKRARVELPPFHLPMFMLLFLADMVFWAPIAVGILAWDFFHNNGDPFLRRDLMIASFASVLVIAALKILRRSENADTHQWVALAYTLIGLVWAFTLTLW